MKLYTEMDAGEQREWLARRMAFGTHSYDDIHRRVKALAKRIHSTPEKVYKDIQKDARMIAEG